MPRLKEVEGLAYIDLIANDQILTWARNEVIRKYLTNPDKINARKNLYLDSKILCKAVITHHLWLKSADITVFNVDAVELSKELRQLADEEQKQGNAGRENRCISK